ncbi:Helix-turn-helix domain-containing protein [Prevotella sp. ne3005]|jgi:transcriptional regulator GlxA family with amidase domain|uniref:helix-turn-helix domain-containing protein n=1 Tax=Prevotella sp. ne3005 TaxID=1761887 RepID=UPI0008AB18B3|nr:helix-turn-helix domain-containing protein [Prevotella sp. ne3005]SEM51875.1 Helix-turn-helix domain-containing protein [Prevotella sp. ne3005]
MPKSTSKTENNELQQLQAENAALREEIDQLKDEMMRLISRNLDLSERLEDDVDLRRRVEVARELLEGNIERQRNADLQDDGQLMALIEMRVESDMLHQNPDFDTAALARLLGVSQERLNRLFRRQTIYRTPEAYIDNIRLLSAMRMLREQPNYTIAVIAEEAGFGNVRTLQRRFQEAIGMTPVEYRLMMTRDN